MVVVAADEEDAEAAAHLGLDPGADAGVVGTEAGGGGRRGRLAVRDPDIGLGAGDDDLLEARLEHDVGLVGAGGGDEERCEEGAAEEEVARRGEGHRRS
jgi:hypothetical protein